jgi:DNA-binding MarR family transcriptional regulator
MEDLTNQGGGQVPNAAAAAPPCDMMNALLERTKRCEMRAVRQRSFSQIDDIAASWKREVPDRDLTGFLLAVYIMRMGRMVDDTFDRMCRQTFDISGADMRVLFALRRAGRPYERRSTDLYRALLVTSGAISKQVDRLSDRGLVERSIGADDSGAVVRLTAKGLKNVKIAFELLMGDSIIATTIAGLSPAQKKSAYALCEHMLRNLQTNGEPAS